MLCAAQFVRVFSPEWTTLILEVKDLPSSWTHQLETRRRPMGGRLKNDQAFHGNAFASHASRYKEITQWPPRPQTVYYSHNISRLFLQLKDLLKRGLFCVFCGLLTLPISRWTPLKKCIIGLIVDFHGKFMRPAPAPKACVLVKCMFTLSYLKACHYLGCTWDLKGSLETHTAFIMSILP